jgi:hypothetical protein
VGESRRSVLKTSESAAPPARLNHLLASLGKGAPAGRISTQREVRLASVDGQLAPGIGARLCVRCLTSTRYKVLRCTQRLRTAKLSIIAAGICWSYATLYSSMRRFVFRILLLLEAPNTIDLMSFWRQTYSIASRGLIAPEARTDIATGLNLRDAMAFS